MTKAQQTYERIEALVARGTDRAAAFQQLSEEYRQPLHSVRSAYYVGRKQANGEDTGTSRPRRSRKRETTEQDAVERAVASLENSISDIESEVELAAERALEASAEHEALQQMSGPRIEAIRAKIAALTDAGGTD